MIDLLIYTIGYESRSSHAVSQIEHKASVGIVVSKNREIEFAQNFESAKIRGSTLLDEVAIEEELPRVLAKSRAGRLTTDPLIVGIDVSSMSRSMMSEAFLCLWPELISKSITLKILYSEAEYRAPSIEESPFLDLNPIEKLEGWSIYPERPLSLIVGLGYEPDLASAAIEYLDPSGAWIFIAEGGDERYKEDVLKSNASLGLLVNEEDFITYKPRYPKRMFTEMFSLARALTYRSRLTIVTGGPKLFSAISILIKLILGDEVAVWKVSHHNYSSIRNCFPSGRIIEFEYAFDGED